MTEQERLIIEAERRDMREQCAKVVEDVYRHTASMTKERDFAHKILPRVAAAIRQLKE